MNFQCVVYVAAVIETSPELEEQLPQFEADLNANMPVKDYFKLTLEGNAIIIACTVMNLEEERNLSIGKINKFFQAENPSVLLEPSVYNSIEEMEEAISAHAPQL